MRIVIDLQGAQSSGSRNRGIGRYTMAMTQAIIRNKGKHEIIIALNGLFPDTIEPIRAAFDGLMPQDQIRVWYAPGPVYHIEPANNWRRNAAELIREAFLSSLKPDIVYVTSLFEGMNEDIVTSIGLLTQAIPTAVTLYDLIPLINRKSYLDNPVVESWYENKLDQLRRADLLLAISESSREEGIRYLGFPLDQAIHVGTAADPQFQCIDISNAKKRSVRERHGLLREFVMYTGGADHRKNIDGLIRAYALLPKSLRENHQLAIVSSVQPESHRLLEELAKQQGLAADEVILTGFVSEEDLIALYHLCKAFVFPSWHEGFGLPALEAMSCGAAVIAANTSSLPEVIGREDALFDPLDDKSIAEKLTQVLTDSAYRAELIRHGLEQAKRFSWDESAKVAITAFERCHARREKSRQSASLSKHRPKLAYISPLPPERSGIADYSAELLPELSRHYEIEVIVAQDTIADPWIKENCSVRGVEWFASHAHHYERVLYHFGNSHYHQHMFGLLEQVPGVVVLHDFFLGDVVAHIANQNWERGARGAWEAALYCNHGYNALIDFIANRDVQAAVNRYPCNKTVLENATGIIVHSDNSRLLARQWLGQNFANDWSVIPHLHVNAMPMRRAEARKALGLDVDAFLVCSFGLLGPTKQNARLLDAWLASPLSKDKSCHLVFVGGNHAGDYGAELTTTIHNSGFSDRIRITGWIDTIQFRQYLAAADVGVQLRTMSRGETSGTVLDCMNYGLPTIVNASGAMAELSTDAVCMLPDEFTDDELMSALISLWKDEKKRTQLSKQSHELIRTRHSPRHCADLYAKAIENYYFVAESDAHHLINQIVKASNCPIAEASLQSTAKAIAQISPINRTARQLLVDVSVIMQNDFKTGIQRVVRALLIELIKSPPVGYRIEPVYLTDADGYWHYLYARRYTLELVGCASTKLAEAGSPNGWLEDDHVELMSDDLLAVLDLTGNLVVQAEKAGLYQNLKNIGVKLWFMVYDILPIKLPKAFPSAAPAAFEEWLGSVCRLADGALCISRSVADELTEYTKVLNPNRLRPLKIGWFHLGADVEGSAPTFGLPEEVDKVLNTLSVRPTFLMVGTVEPRKGQTQALEAFSLLWAQGVDANLVIVGKQGWMMEALIDSIQGHPEKNYRLFWLAGISDEYLEKIYAASSCLIAASEGEGFGLPLIEAAQHKLPIIARDIPVFREVAGDHAFYFSGLTHNALADCVREWLSLDKAGQIPQSNTMPWLTWKQSTQGLLDVIIGDQWYQRWMPDEVRRFWGSDNRLSTQVGKRTGRDIVSTGQAGFLLFGPYIALAAGQYRVVIHGTFGENGLAGARMDVTVDKGAHILGQSALGKPDKGDCLVALPISLDASYDDFEVRMWVEAASNVTISLLEIQQLRSSGIESSASPPIAETAAISPRQEQSISVTLRSAIETIATQPIHKMPLSKKPRRKKSVLSQRLR